MVAVILNITPNLFKRLTYQTSKSGTPELKFGKRLLKDHIAKCLSYKIGRKHTVIEGKNHYIDGFEGGLILFTNDEEIALMFDYDEEPSQELIDRMPQYLQECADEAGDRSERLSSGVKKGVEKKQIRNTMRGMVRTPLPMNVIGEIGEYTATGKIEGGRRRKTRRSKKTKGKSRKLRR